MDAELIVLSAVTVVALGAAVWAIRRPRTVELPPLPAVDRPPIAFEAGTAPNFAEMGIDELGAWKHARKTHGLESGESERVWRSEVKVANQVQDAKIAEWHLEEARLQIRKRAALDGREPDAVAREWLTSDQQGRQVQARLWFGFPRLGREAPRWTLDRALRELDQ